jgi:hypothetical protein
MVVVYKARHVELGKLVALKVYSVTSDADIDELLAEARVLFSVTPHASLPVVRGDFFTDDRERYVMVMDWIDGIDLQQVLDTEGDPGLALSQVLDAVAQAANRSITSTPRAADRHGDVKPASSTMQPPAKSCSSTSTSPGRGVPGGSGRNARVHGAGGAGRRSGPEADVYGLRRHRNSNGLPPVSSFPGRLGIEPAQAVARASRAAARRIRRRGDVGRTTGGTAPAPIPPPSRGALATEVVWDACQDRKRGDGSATTPRRPAGAGGGSRDGRIVATMNGRPHRSRCFPRDRRQSSPPALQDRVEIEVFPAGIGALTDRDRDQQTEEQ